MVSWRRVRRAAPTTLPRLRPHLPIRLRGLLQGEERRGLELVLHVQLAELRRRRLGEAAREAVAALVPAQVLAARVPERVRLVPPRLVVAVGVDAGGALLVRRHARGEVLVAPLTQVARRALLRGHGGEPDDAREALVLAAALEGGAEEGVRLGADGLDRGAGLVQVVGGRGRAGLLEELRLRHAEAG